jgi:hypothetical protein
MRDLVEEPYTPDEERVAKWYSDHGIGGGDDPIGALIVSHEYLARERGKLLRQLAALSTLAERGMDGLSLEDREKVSRLKMAYED